MVNKHFRLKPRTDEDAKLSRSFDSVELGLASGSSPCGAVKYTCTLSYTGREDGRQGLH